MSQIILFDMITLDGFFAGPHGEIDWHNVDEEFNQYAIQQLEEAGGLIFGRVTYEMMASYWPTPEAIHDDAIVAGKMNSLPKFVCSRTLASAGWSNTRLVRDVAEIAALKQQQSRDLFVFGSANLSAALIQKDLIDEFRLIVNPLILGRGMPAFQGIDAPMQLHLERVKPFQNGNVLLVYRK